MEGLRLWEMTHRRVLEDKAESHRWTPGMQEGSSKSGLGFPTSAALVLLTGFSISAIFSCCFHWHRSRSRNSSSSPSPFLQPHSIFASPIMLLRVSTTDMPHKIPNLRMVESFPVVMPGDDMPKFVALACPPIARIELPPLHHADLISLERGQFKPS